MYQFRFCTIAIVFILSACSGPGSESGRTPDTIFRDNLGTSGRGHIVSTSQDALITRYGYRFNREVNTAEDVRLETSWKDVSPFADELESGYTEVRIRIVVSARPRSRALGTASTYTARFEAEFESRLVVGGDWEPIPMTPEREAYIEEIADYLENEFKAGVM